MAGASEQLEEAEEKESYLSNNRPAVGGPCSVLNSTLSYLNQLLPFSGS